MKEIVTLLVQVEVPIVPTPGMTLNELGEDIHRSVQRAIPKLGHSGLTVVNAKYTRGDTIWVTIALKP